MVIATFGGQQGTLNHGCRSRQLRGMSVLSASVTVPLYIGLGASGGSYLRDVFYLNTFDVGEYIRALAAGRLPVALVLGLSEAMQRAGWLYWRIYETRFRKAAYRERFGVRRNR